MHVLVPIARRHTYDDTRRFAEIIAGALARTHRGLVRRSGRSRSAAACSIDANQNGEGKTIASVYSVRPKAGAPVSTPLRWDEVNEALNPSIYSMQVVLDRIRRQGDLFEGVLTTKQSLAKALRAIS
jgi:bifunctional non-homologous end joining protein LigD